MDNVTIHPRVNERHPEICDADVLDAWQNCIRAVPRIDKNPNEYIAVGADSNGRLIEVIALRSLDGDWLIYHAMTPPTRRVLRELGMVGR
jgi:hypothetical protein